MELAKTDNGGTLATSGKTHRVLAVDFDTMENLPDLNEKVVESPVSLSSSYWTPEAINETKKLFFGGFEVQKQNDPVTQEVKALEVAIFIEQTIDASKKKSIQKIVNGSKKLVGILQNALDAKAIQIGSAISVTYLGKKKNKTNNLQSDNWEVRNLMQAIEQPKEA